MTRIAIAIELKVPDDLELHDIAVQPYGTGIAVLPTRIPHLIQAIRYEVQPDPDAVFAPEGERENDHDDAGDPPAEWCGVCGGQPCDGKAGGCTAVDAK